MQEKISEQTKYIEKVRKLKRRKKSKIYSFNNGMPAK